MPLYGVALLDPPDFGAWLLKKHGSLAGINTALKTKLVALDDIGPSATLPANRLFRQAWLAFAVETVPVERWQIPHPCRYYHAFLQQRYGHVSDDARPLQAAFDRLEFVQRKRELVKFFLTDNFVQVFRYIAVQGRALGNTLILVGANLLAALTINPMAAYALSRFKIKNKQAILIAFLLPISFPGEVTQIPSFILVRDLGLLNTYWALIICPAQEKWTLAVWVFQFSVDAMEKGQGHLQMAALVLMRIPTIFIFLFTQRIIMKGIVLPTMK